MIQFTTGNILKAKAQALVNTVNCEGYMGKGIAYQFKLEYPHNNDVYERACKTGKLKVGNVLVVEEENKFIFNFPTKDKWREKSKYEYIENGLKNLKEQLVELKINSVAIPPLGCGNGGLSWPKVKEMLVSQLNDVSENCEITIYEPSKNITTQTKAKKPPKLNTSHLLLMNLKMNLHRFNKLRLQKTSYLINYLSEENYFKFEAHHYGPYAHSLEILSKNIKEYQLYYGFDTKKAYKHAKTVLISDTTVSKEKAFLPFLKKATNIVNQIDSDKELELLTTLLYLIEKNRLIKKENLIEEFANWSERKAQSFSSNEILSGIEKLKSLHLIQDELYGLSRIKEEGTVPNPKK